jgi:hypothetical protein
MMNKTEQRFEAAKAAMQGNCVNYEWCKYAAMNLKQDQTIAEAVVVASIDLADALLAELARTEPTCKDFLQVPDADGWVVRIPTDPIPERHNGVRFGDGVERLTQDRKWPNGFWNHADKDWPSDFITHYRPA